MASLIPEVIGEIFLFPVSCVPAAIAPGEVSRVASCVLSPIPTQLFRLGQTSKWPLATLWQSDRFAGRQDFFAGE